MPPESGESDSDCPSEIIIKRFETNESESKNVQNLKYVCKHPGCDAAFKKMNDFDRHEYNQHKGNKKYICPHEGCDKSYVIADHIKRHIRVTHEKVLVEKSIKCLVETCNVRFILKENLMRHMKNVHENPSLQVCSECSMTFRQKGQLRRHLITHTGNYPHKCDVCEKGFLSYKSLQNHKKVHGKIYTCEICNKTYTKWSNLIFHKKSHENVKVFKCTTCDKSYSFKCRLEKHMEMHKKDDANMVYTCPYDDCTKFYALKRNLTVHIKSKHEGLKFKCPIESCGAELTAKHKLEYHMKLHKKYPNKTKIAKYKFVKDKDKKRRKRKDAGKKKISIAEALSNVELMPESQKMMVVDGTESEIEVDKNIKEDNVSNLDLQNGGNNAEQKIDT